jgi:hypothetical protein
MPTWEWRPGWAGRGNRARRLSLQSQAPVARWITARSEAERNSGNLFASQSNPCKGVPEAALPTSLREWLLRTRVSAAPYQGLVWLSDDSPEFRYASLRALFRRTCRCATRGLNSKLPRMFRWVALVEKTRIWRGSSFVLKHAATRNERVTAQSSGVDLFGAPGFSRVA